MPSERAAVWVQPRPGDLLAIMDRHGWPVVFALLLLWSLLVTIPAGSERMANAIAAAASRNEAQLAALGQTLQASLARQEQLLHDMQARIR